MKYTKHAITTAEQICILRQRGLIVDDENQAREALDVISYFRLADYWRYLEIDHTTHQFKPNCHFSEILDYYYFDKELKALLLEVVSFGTLSKLFGNFKDATVKHQVAHEFGLNHHKFLKSWMEMLVALRNYCAHHSRVWNRRFPVKPQTPRKMPQKWISNFSFRQETIYPQLCCIAYWLGSIYPQNTFVIDLKAIFSKHPSVSTQLMGFPSKWMEEPLWK